MDKLRSTLKQLVRDWSEEVMSHSNIHAHMIRSDNLTRDRTSGINAIDP